MLHEKKIHEMEQNPTSKWTLRASHHSSFLLSKRHLDVKIFLHLAKQSINLARANMFFFLGKYFQIKQALLSEKSWTAIVTSCLSDDWTYSNFIFWVWNFFFFHYFIYFFQNLIFWIFWIFFFLNFEFWFFDFFFSKFDDFFYLLEPHWECFRFENIL